MNCTKIPTGYKQTEVGVIPEDWVVKEYGEISVVRKEKYDSKKLGSHSFCVELEHIGQGSGNLIGFAETSVLSSIKNVFRKNDVLFGRLRAYLKKYWKANRDGVASSEIWPLIANKDITISEYLFQLVQTRSFIESASETYGTHMPRSDWNVVRRKRIPLPSSKTEQTAIATVLSNIDSLIERLEKLIAKKRAIKQGAMQELLTGKRRLPGFSGKWDAKKLGEIAEIKTGKKNNDDKVGEGLYPFFVRSQQVERINSYSFDGEAILTPGEGNIGNIYHYINGKFDYHQRVYKISNFAEQYSGKFIYLSMSQNFNAHAMKNSVKATVDSLRLPTFKEFEISFPPTKAEQIAISTIISNMDAEINKLDQKLTKYKMLKQGMMQVLLTGRIRLV